MKEKERIMCHKKENDLFERPYVTSPCYDDFEIDLNKVFMDNNGNTFQLCPHCGYMVNIPKEIFNEEDINTIIKRCNEDKTLFRRNYLVSELTALERFTPNDKKMLK